MDVLPQPGNGDRRGRKALGVAKVVYTGKPGVRPALRVTQGIMAGVFTLALVGAVLPDPPEEPTSSFAAAAGSRAAPSPESTSEAEQVAAAESQQKAAAAGAAKAAAERRAAAKRAADLAAARKLAAQRAAAQREAAERAARERAAAAAAAQAAAAQQQVSSSCHEAYATCVPVKGDGSGAGDANDLDCGDIGFSVRLRQIGWDPYRLDADDDGIGCE